MFYFSFNLMTTLSKLINQRLFPLSEKETNLQVMETLVKVLTHYHPREKRFLSIFRIYWTGPDIL